MSSCQTIISLLSGINRDVQFSRPPQPTDIYQLGDVVVGVVFVFVVVCFASVGFRFVRRCEHDLQATGGGRSPWIAVIGSQILHIFIVSRSLDGGKFGPTGIVAATHARSDHPCTLDAFTSKLIGHCWRALSARLATTRRPSAPHAFLSRPADRLVTGWPLNGRHDPWSCPSIRRRGWSSAAWLSRPYTVVDLNGCDCFSASPIPPSRRPIRTPAGYTHHLSCVGWTGDSCHNARISPAVHLYFIRAIRILQ